MVKEGIIPKSYKETLDLLHHNDLTIIAGGTDLMVKKRNWSSLLPKFSKDVLLITELKELKFIKRDKGNIHIGANVTLEDVKACRYVPDILKKAITLMASPAIRHTGTIGGNICNASPAGDTLPPLYLLDAVVVLESLEGERQMPIEDFLLGPGKTALDKKEIMREIIIKEKAFTNVYYEKVGGRKADAISKVSFTGVAVLKNDRIEEFGVAFGAVGPKVVRKPDIENQIIGMSRSEAKEKIEWIKNSYKSNITPIDDQRSTAAYRKVCSINLLENFILNL